MLSDRFIHLVYTYYNQLEFTRLKGLVFTNHFCVWILIRLERRQNQELIAYCIINASTFVIPSCRISGTGVCLGIAAYTYNVYRKTPLTKVGDRRFSLVMSLGFAALGIYRGLLY